MSDFEQKVRAYTPEERAEIEWQPDPNATAEDRMARRKRIHEIDVARYTEAAYKHPELWSHMARMIIVSANALRGWQRFYDMPVDEPGVVVPYAGTESPAEVQQAAKPDPQRAALIA